MHSYARTYTLTCASAYSRAILTLSLTLQLSGEERAIVELKYGLHGHEPHSLREICKARGCTSKEVRSANANPNPNPNPHPPPPPTLTLTLTRCTARSRAPCAS